MLSRFKMAPRLALGFSALMALAALIGAFAMSCLADVNGNTRDIATNWLVSTRALGQYRDAVGLVRRVEVITALMSGAAHEEEQDKAIEQGKRDARDAWKLYVPTITDGPERQLAERIVEAQDAYYVQQGKVKQMGSQPELRDQALAAYLGESRAAYQKLATAIHDDIAYQTRGGNAAYASAQASYTKARYEILGLLATAMVVGAFLAWKITVSITKPLMIAVDAAERVAKGNLHEMRVVAGRDETGQLLRSLADMRRSLVDVVGQVRTSADSIATGSSQIASGSIDLSQRTEEQASNLQQTAASMEELTATVRQNADSATAAMSMAAETAVAVTGVRETAQAVARSMLKIEESSRKVSDIIGVIDGIAFQTNILALNAAVEAARAGEHGRGFAVVASEVRALAQRSAGAAKEIKGLIALSSGAVEAGSEQVNRAGVAIGNIAGRVAQVDELVAQIAIASREQSTGIGQVGDAVGQLDQVTQQNAALVEESAAAAESLRVQAARLAETVSFFQIESADLTHAV